MKSLREKYDNIRFRYKVYFVAIVITSLALSAYPTWILSMNLAETLGIPLDSPVNEQKNGFVWLIGFILIAIVNFLVASGVVIYVVCRIKGWSRNQAIEYLFKYNVPKHWNK